MSLLRTLKAVLGIVDDYDVRDPRTNEKLTHDNGKWVDSKGNAVQPPDVRRFAGMDRVDDRMKPPKERR